METRLADLTPLSQTGVATFRENAGHQDAQIDINGQTFFHGIGMHPLGNPVSVAVVEYNLDGATRFTAIAGLNDTVLPAGNGQVTFRAYVDDVLVFDSGRVDTNSAAVDVDFDTTGGSVLRLEVDPDGQVSADHAVWANATLTGAMNQPTTISIAETAPNGTLVGTYNGSDVDPGDTLTYSLFDSANGRFAIDPNTGVITVDDANQLDFETASSHMITVRIDDGTTFTDDVVTIELSDVNESPMGMDDAITINEDATHTFAAADFGFVDIEGDTLLEIRIESPPTSGTLALNGTPVTSNQDIDVTDLPNLTYTPDADRNGQNFDSFDFSVRDSRQQFSDNTNTLTFHVDPVNDAPIASVVTLPDLVEDSGPVIITQSDLLVNASDPDGGSLTAENLSIAAGNGTLSDNGDGTWTYTPAAGDDTEVSFTFTVSDGSITTGNVAAELDITPDVLPSIPGTPVPDNGGSGTNEPNEPDNQTTGTDEASNNPENESDSDNETDDEDSLQPILTSPVIRSQEPPAQREARTAFQQNFSDEELRSAEILREIEEPELVKKILTGIAAETAAGAREAELPGFGSAGPQLITEAGIQLWENLKHFSQPSDVNLALRVSVGAVTVLGTFGGILWALRGGTLMAVAFTQLPSWNFIDPLPILEGNTRRKDTDKDGAEDLAKFF